MAETLMGPCAFLLLLWNGYEIRTLSSVAPHLARTHTVVCEVAGTNGLAMVMALFVSHNTQC